MKIMIITEVSQRAPQNLPNMKTWFSVITHTKLIYIPLSYQQALQSIKPEKYSFKNCALGII